MEDKLFDVSGKICIVTGGLGQIGKNMAREFYIRGAKVAIFARHVNPEKVQAVFPPEEYDADRMKFYAVDIAPPEVSGPFENFPEEVFREVVDVNLVGTFLCCQAVGSRMIRAGKGGSIINVGSIYGMLSPIQDIYKYKEERTGIPFIKPVAYSAAKSGIYNLTRYLATYWGKKGIRVNTLTPAGVWRDTQDETFIANFTARMPMGRMSREDEYNGAVIFLASDASSFMTGSNLVIDGGWTAW